jgi:tetratricopeptide (TPR) repeat protein
MYLSTHPATEARTALFGGIGAAERGAVLAEPWIEKGRALARQGKHREAVGDFDRAFAHTRTAALLRLRAKSYFEIADYTHAEADLAEALALEPESAATLAARAEVLALGRQKPDEAIAVAQAALRLEPKNATALVALGLAETSRGELAAALQHLDAAVFAAPADARALAYRGEVRRRREDIRGALADYDRALELNPHVEWVRLARAFCRNREENFAGALADFDLVFAPGLRTVQYHYERARAHHGLGQFDRAIAEFTSGERKAKANDERQQLHFSRGLTYFSASNFRAAVADLTAAIDLAPAQPEAYLRRAAAYRALGEPERAFADLERAGEHGAAGEALRFERGSALWGLGRAEEALQELEPLLAGGAAPAPVWRARGLVHFSRQRWAEAEADFSAYLREAKRGTEYAEFFRLLARRRGGRDDEAAAFAATVGGWKPGWPKAVGRYLAAEIDESQLLAQTLLGDQPPAAERRCEAYFYIAETLLARGETAGAREFFQKCVGTGVSGYVEYTLARAELQRVEKR